MPLAATTMAPGTSGLPLAATPLAPGTRAMPPGRDDEGTSRRCDASGRGDDGPGHRCDAAGREGDTGIMEPCEASIEDLADYGATTVLKEKMPRHRAGAAYPEPDCRWRALRLRP